MLLTLIQLGISVILLIGWSYPVWYVAGQGSLGHRAWWAWCVLGGAAVHPLLLQQLWYLGLPISTSAWISFSIALLGCAAWLKRSNATASLPVRNSLRPQFYAAAAVVALICSLQGASLLIRGPQHYFGRGEYDQFNYVATAQFLVEYSAKSPTADFAGWPVFLRGKEGSEERITQSVANAELAVLSRTDAQQTYGTAVLVFLSLLGVAAFGYSRVFGRSLVRSAIIASIAGVLPAVTNVHLNGFFSQTCVFWVFVAISGVLFCRRDNGCACLIAGLFVGWLIGAYTELAPVGYATAVITILASSKSKNWIRLVGAVTLTALVLNMGYLRRAGAFFLSQLVQAKGPDFLASWTPDSGTWKGFGRNFTGEVADSIQVAVGLGLLCFVVLVLAVSRKPYRSLVVVTLLIPVLALSGMLLLPELPSYAFGKLLMSVAPVFFLAAFSPRAPRRWMLDELSMALAAAIGFFSLRELYLAQKEVIEGTNKIAAVDMSSVSRALDVISGQTVPPTFIIGAENPLSAGWLSYFLRGQNAFLWFQEVSDRSFPSEWHVFRRPPAGLKTVYWIDDTKLQPLPDYDPYPAVSISGASEAKVGNTRVWRSASEIRIDIRSLARRPGRLRWICFRLMGPPGATAAEIYTPDGSASVSMGQMAAIPANMESESYRVRVRSMNNVPLTLWLYGLEPVRSSFNEPYPFELVKLRR